MFNFFFLSFFLSLVSIPKGIDHGVVQVEVDHVATVEAEAEAEAEAVVMKSNVAHIALVAEENCIKIVLITETQILTMKKDDISDQIKQGAGIEVMLILMLTNLAIKVEVEAEVEVEVEASVQNDLQSNL